MLAFTIRRLSQSVIVLFVMSIIVFAGVFAIGNPVDILINPEADIAEQEATIARLGLDKPMWEQPHSFQTLYTGIWEIPLSITFPPLKSLCHACLQRWS